MPTVLPGAWLLTWHFRVPARCRRLLHPYGRARARLGSVTPAVPSAWLSGVPEPQERGGQHVASAALEDGAQAASEGLEPMAVWPRPRRLVDYLAGEGLRSLLVSGRERESGQRLGNRLGEFRQRSSINATRLNRIARMLSNAV